MAIGELCNREVVIVSPGTNLTGAAELMRKHHVGDVVVVREDEGLRKPLGIVTDRDLVVEAMAYGLDPATMMVEEIMAPNLATLEENTGVFEAIRYMRDKAVRRMPVVDAKGALVGIMAIDDLLQLFAEEMCALSTLMQREQTREARERA